MKKLVACMLCACMVSGLLVGCGNDGGTAGTDTNAGTTETSDSDAAADTGESDAAESDAAESEAADSGSTSSGDANTINVWAFTDEVPGMIEKFIEAHPDFGYDINTTITPRQTAHISLLWIRRWQQAALRLPTFTVQRQLSY